MGRRGRSERPPVRYSPAGALVAVLSLFVVALFVVLGFPPGSDVAPAAATGGSAPLRSAVSTANGSWVVLPIGELGDQSNTFWQLLYGGPGSSHWSVVTPEGVADNGGIVAGVSPVSADVGVLPSGLLRFSPLARSTDGGRTWSPALVPGALAERPDTLAAPPDVAGEALAVVGRSVLRSPSDLSSWSRTTSVSALGTTSPGCGATEIDAVAVAPDGTPLAATDCRRGGRVGIFSRVAGRWSATGPALGGRLRQASTEVLRLEPTGAQVTALVLATAAGRRSLVALWSAPHGRWTASAALALPSSSTVVSTALGATGTVAALEGGPGAAVPYTVKPGAGWSRLPTPPHGTVALAVGAPSAAGSDAGFDAFTVSQTRLGVYATSTADPAWVEVQSTRVPLSYGSSG
jgi:hypothetical protein